MEETRAPIKPPAPSRVKNRAEAMVRVQWGIGLAITLAMLVLSRTDLLDRLEFVVQDFNAQRFTASSPDPDPRLVMIGIDDVSITTVGKWPWPRERLAQVVRELTRAGAGVIALDLLQDDIQAPRPELDLDDPGKVARMVDGDAEFAAAVKEHGKVVLGGSFRFDKAIEDEASQTGVGGGFKRIPLGDIYRAIMAEPATTDEALRIMFLGAEASKSGGAASDDLAAKIRRTRVLIRRREEFSIPAPAAEGGGWPVSSEPGPPVAKILDAGARLASVSFGSTDVDRAVRRVPMWVEQGGRLYPTLGLASASLLMGIGMQDIRLEGPFTVLRSPSGSEFRLRMHRASLKGIGQIGGLYYITWPRGGGWKQQFIDLEEKRKWDEEEQKRQTLAKAHPQPTPGYGLPQLDPAAQGVCAAPQVAITDDATSRIPPGTDLPIGKILDPTLTHERLQGNIRMIDGALARASTLGVGLVDRAERHAERSRKLQTMSPDEPGWRDLYAEHRAEWMRAIESAKGYVEAFAAVPEAELRPEEKQQLITSCDCFRGLAVSIVENDAGLQNTDRLRASLRERLRGKLCMVGWTSTGALADFVQTSIDNRTPGVYVHAAMANSVFTEYARAASGSFVAWVGVIGLGVMGVLGTLIGVRVGVVVGPIVLVLTLAVWLFFSGFVIWDRFGAVIVFAAPMAAGAASWLGVILHRLLIEQRGRKQTEARFRSYVSPDVVDILVNNPELQSMAPQKRELTIMFSDVANWTTLTERLGTEGIFKFLSTYLGEMTDIIQRNKATLDKYLGDGIMAFWGAPVEDPDHAKNAAKACVEMLDRLDEMNRNKEYGDAGTIEVRFGIATGEVNVGDFGNPPHKSAYTVIGDAVNLSARLESSNKQFGTSILMTKRVVDLSGSALLFRPIGRIVVKGKTEYDELYELIGDRKPKGERTAEWIETTQRAVAVYQSGDLDGAEALFSTLESSFGDGKLAKLYLHAIEELKAKGVPPDWEGTLVLTEK